MTFDEAQQAAMAMIAQGRLDDEAASLEENKRETEGYVTPAPVVEVPAPVPEKAPVTPLGKVGDWVDYDPGNKQPRPAMVTHVDEKTGLVSLMVVYKSHIDFIGEVGHED